MYRYNIKIRKHTHNYIIDQNIQYKSQCLVLKCCLTLIFPPPPPPTKNHVASKQECARKNKTVCNKSPSPLPPPSHLSHTTKRFSYIPAYSYRIKIKNSTATFCQKSTRQYSKPIFQNSYNSYSDWYLLKSTHKAYLSFTSGENLCQ